MKVVSVGRWLPLDMREVKDENPKVPVAIMITEADEPPAPAAYAHRYDLRISYTRDADIVHGQACDMRVLTAPESSPSGGATVRGKPRPKLVASFISNCGAGTRDKLLQELMSVVPVDNYGACFHNVDSPVTRGSSNWVAVKEGILSDYVFAIAFENKVGFFPTPCATTPVHCKYLSYSCCTPAVFVFCVVCGSGPCFRLQKTTSRRRCLTP